MMWPTRVSLLVLLTLLGTVAARAQGASDKTPAVVLRLERARGEHLTCVALRNNGDFHFEDISRRQAREGSLTDESFLTVSRLLRSGKLAAIHQADIKHGLLTVVDDVFAVTYRSEGKWHFLDFPEKANRDAYGDAVEPLVAWMEDVEKQGRLPSARKVEATNCRIPGLKADESTWFGQNAVAAGKVREIAPDSGLLMYLVREPGSVGLRVACATVREDGEYHYEVAESSHWRLLPPKVFEGKVAGDMAELHAILNEPELAGLQHAGALPSDTRWADSVREKLVNVVRPGGMQRLRFVTAFGVRRGQNEVGGISGGTPALDEKEELVKPLEKWLEKNVMKPSRTPTPGAESNGCRLESKYR